MSRGKIGKHFTFYFEEIPNTPPELKAPYDGTLFQEGLIGMRKREIKRKTTHKECRVHSSQFWHLFLYR
jgi:hypothetical protein